MFRKRHPPAGSQPGMLVIAPESPRPRIHVIEYGPDHVEEYDVADVEALERRPKAAIRWVDVQGLGDEGVLRRLAEIFSIHPLAIEDAVNVPHRPKVEHYPQHDFLITRVVLMEDLPRLETEQVSIVVSERELLTFQERHTDVLDPVCARIRGRGPICGRDAGFLAYAILDTVIDRYYPILEALGEFLEELEDEVVLDATPALLQRIHDSKRALSTLRRTIWPQRDAINALLRDEHPFVAESNRVYVRDCYDHAVQILDVVETYRELAAGLMDVYLSSLSNRTNEIMKVLTVMATIFIPLTFIVGVYGMNFEYMPELHQRWAYPLLWLAMGAIAGGMLVYFRRRGWLGTDEVTAEDGDP